MFKKRIGITQKIMQHPRYDETLDCLDMRWADLLLSLDLQPIPLPNIDARYVDAQLSSLKLDGLILSGGNTIVTSVDEFSANAALLKDRSADNLGADRDFYEYALLHALLGDATKAGIPVLGVCRGMQIINLFYGGALAKISGHAGDGDHKIMPLDDGAGNEFPDSVNSYHDFGIPREMLAGSLRALVSDEDGRVEAFEHAQHNVRAIMWHPERENPFKQKDLDLIKRMFATDD